MAKTNYDEDRRYSPHAFRRGATEEIKNSGSTTDTIIKSDIWAAAGRRPYLGIQIDETSNISRLLLETANSDSDDSDNDIRDVSRTLRKKLNKNPMELKQEKPPIGP